MQRYRVLQTYVPPLIADWILDQSNTRDTSVSVVIRDHLVAAWNRDNDSACLLYTSPSPRDRQKPRMPSSA